MGLLLYDGANQTQVCMLVTKVTRVLVMYAGLGHVVLQKEYCLHTGK
jgi:hypothetical protein